VPAVEVPVVVDTQRRGRLAEYAYEYTKRQLFDGTLSPGQKVRVEDVVARLSTSRQPVMDAFKRLAAEGYLDIIPQVGCRVVVPTLAEIADFFLILGAVQGMAADLAAARRHPDEIAALRAISASIDTLREADRDDDFIAAIRPLDRAFLHQITVMAHSDAVVSVAHGLLDRSDFYIGCLPAAARIDATRPMHAPAEHRAIVDAIDAGDGDRARALVEAHILAIGKGAQAFPLPEFA